MKTKSARYLVPAISESANQRISESVKLQLSSLGSIWICSLLFFFVFSSNGCSDEFNSTVGKIDRRTTVWESCLPNDYQTLSTSFGGYTYDMYQYGYIHNAIIDSFYAIELEELCTVAYMETIHNKVDSVLNVMGMDQYEIPFDPGGVDLFQAWCEDYLEDAMDICLTELNEVDYAIDTFDIFTAEEREFIYEFIVDLIEGTVDSDQAILDYKNITSPYKGGLISGTIVAIGIASHCYWSNLPAPPSIDGNQKILPRGLGAMAALDACGAYYSFMSYMYDNPDFANDNCTWGTPGCGDGMGARLRDAAVTTSMGGWRGWKKWFG